LCLLWWQYSVLTNLSVGGITVRICDLQELIIFFMLLLQKSDMYVLLNYINRKIKILWHIDSLAKRRLCKPRQLIGNAWNIQTRNNRRTVFSIWSVPKGYEQGTKLVLIYLIPCGGGIEYLHRSPASRRRRRKRKSRICEAVKNDCAGEDHQQL
jgi:hypothetical protein